MFFQRGLPLQLIHDIRHLNSKMSEVETMSNDLSVGTSGGGRGGGGKQLVKKANASNRGRVCLLQAPNYEEIVISKTTTQEFEVIAVSFPGVITTSCLLRNQNSIAKCR